jgi:exosome complex RNA-binding protein Rrp42 (RNase PH superfamily)
MAATNAGRFATKQIEFDYRKGVHLIASVIILQDSGNLMDAALLACMTAWKDTTLPTMDQLKESQQKLWWKESPLSSVNNNTVDIIMKDSDEMEYRVSLTMGLLGGGDEAEARFLVDPSSEEAEFTDGELTIVVTLPNRTLQIEYTGSIGLDASDLALAAKLANGRADELSSLL